MLLSPRKKRILFYYACNTRESTKPFYMSSFRAFFVCFFSFVKAKGLKFDMTIRVMGPNPRKSIRRGLSSAPEEIHSAKQKQPSNMGSGKAVSPQQKHFPVIGFILKICKRTLTCFGATGKTFQLKTVSSSTVYLTANKSTLGTNTVKSSD